MANLQLAVNGEYFDQMKSGEKTEEYRMVNPYWAAASTAKTMTV